MRIAARLLEPSQRDFALRFKPFAEEINPSCTGREVNLNSKLGQPPHRAFSLPPRSEATEEAAVGSPVPREAPGSSWDGEELPLTHVQSHAGGVGRAEEAPADRPARGAGA